MLGTLAYAKKLEAAGIPAAQAEVYVETVLEIFGETVKKAREEADHCRLETAKSQFEASQLCLQISQLKAELAEAKRKLKID